MDLQYLYVIRRIKRHLLMVEGCVLGRMGVRSQIEPLPISAACVLPYLGTGLAQVAGVSSIPLE